MFKPLFFHDGFGLSQMFFLTVKVFEEDNWVLGENRRMFSSSKAKSRNIMRVFCFVFKAVFSLFYSLSKVSGLVSSYCLYNCSYQLYSNPFRLLKHQKLYCQ